MPQLQRNGIIGFFRGDAPFSNHHRCEITFKGRRFCSSEHLYMWQRAEFFAERATGFTQLGLKELQAGILATSDPAKAKQFGKLVFEKYDCSWTEWASVKEEKMVVALLLKFSQNKGLEHV